MGRAAVGPLSDAHTPHPGDDEGVSMTLQHTPIDRKMLGWSPHRSALFFSFSWRARAGAGAWLFRRGEVLEPERGRAEGDDETEIGGVEQEHEHVSLGDD